MVTGELQDLRRTSARGDQRLPAAHQHHQTETAQRDQGSTILLAVLPDYRILLSLSLQVIAASLRYDTLVQSVHSVPYRHS